MGRPRATADPSLATLVRDDKNIPILVLFASSTITHEQGRSLQRGNVLVEPQQAVSSRLRLQILPLSFRDRTLHSSSNFLYFVDSNAFQRRRGGRSLGQTSCAAVESFRDSRRYRWCGTCESESLDRHRSSFSYCAATFEFAHRSAVTSFAGEISPWLGAAW